MSLYNILFDYQQLLIDKYYIKDNFGLFLEMGSGKTILSLALAEKNECSKILIITLNSKAVETKEIKGSWLYWADKSSMSYNLNNKNYKGCFENDNNDCLVLNYEGIYSRDKNRRKKIVLKETVQNFIDSCRGKRVAFIIDESHKMKNIDSLQTKAIFEIKTQLKSISQHLNCYLLTGTPFTNTMLDLYSQLKFLGYDQSKTYFIDNYCIRDNIPGLLGWQQPIIGYKNLDTLFKLVHKYAITIKSEEFLKLPKQEFHYISIKNTECFNLMTNEKYYSKNIKRELDKRNIDNNLNDTNLKINNPFYRNIDYPSDDHICYTSSDFWLRCRQLNIGFVGSEKITWYNYDRLNKLKELVTNNRQNYIIFYNYNAELISLFELFEKLSYNIDIYCGNIKSLENYENFAKISQDKRDSINNNVMLVNYNSGSAGMNWQLYNNCILFSLPLYKDYEQCLKRIHRVGQTKDVNYYIFYSDNWLDKGMIKSLKEKVNYNIELFEKEVSINNE